MPLTTGSRERIVSHLQRGWKLADSLVAELWAAYREQEAEIARLRTALSDYGQHFETCSWDRRMDAESVCDCGLDEALCEPPQQPLVSGAQES